MHPLTHELIDSLFFHKMSPSSHEGVWRVIGVVHLYRASGVHLLAVFIFIKWIIDFIYIHFHFRPNEWKGRISVILFSILSFCIWYRLGFHFSLFRPLCMIYLRTFCRFYGLKPGITLPLFVTFLFEWAIVTLSGISFSLGAHHYYFAVFGSLIAIGRDPIQKGLRSHLKVHFKMSLYSWVPGAMLDLAHDHLVSVFTPFYSFLTLAPIMYFLYPLTLLSLLMGGDVPLLIMHFWSAYLTALETLAACLPPFLVVSEYAIGLALILAVTAFTLFYIKKTRFKLRTLPTLLALICLFRFMHEAIPVHRVVMWDVGQGDSILIQDKGRNEVIDTGPLFRQNQEKWLRRFARYGVLSIDTLLITHPDLDHKGGLKIIENLIPISNRVERNEGEDPVNTLTPPKLMSVEWFESSRKNAKGNQWMAGVMHALSKDEWFLSLGDGDSYQEEKFYEHFKNEIERKKGIIWKVGHHGSRFSGSLPFLKILKPKLGIISVGKKNPYRHPAPEVLARYSYLGIPLLRTDIEGDLVLHSKDEPVSRLERKFKIGF